MKPQPIFPTGLAPISRPQQSQAVLVRWDCIPHYPLQRVGALHALFVLLGSGILIVGEAELPAGHALPVLFAHQDLISLMLALGFMTLIVGRVQHALLGNIWLGALGLLQGRA